VYRMQVVQRAYRLHESDRRLSLRVAQLRSNPAGRVAEVHEWLGLKLADGRARELLAAHPLDLDRAGRFTRAEWTEGVRPDEHDTIAALTGGELIALGY
jgi:hypothetical protein